ncbi:MAG TPA: O-antigen ligase family protein [Variovorax sp.]|nr:O-antigen ligase family protein [Variovorax sp.]
MNPMHGSVRGARWAVGALAVAALAGVAAMATSSVTATLALLAALGAGTYALVVGRLRRSLLAALFLLAPVDISKAVIAPLVARYTAIGPFYSPGLYVSLAHMALLVLLAVWLGRRFATGRGWPGLTALDRLALAFVAFIWLRSLGTEQGVLALGTAMSYSLAVLGFYVVSHAVEDAADVRLVLAVCAAVLGVMFLHAMLQTVTHQPWPLPGSKTLAEGSKVSFGGESTAFRPSGFFNHPNALAHYVVIVWPPALALALLGPARLPRRVWWAAAAATVGGGVMLLVTLSRGGWASASVAALVVTAVFVHRGLVTRRQLGVAMLAGVAGLCVLVVVYPNLLLRLTAPDGRSLESRVLLADMAFTIIRSHPFLGVGFGGYNRAAFAHVAPLFANVSYDYQLSLRQLVVHNHFLLLAAELGVPAMVFFVYLLWRLARQMLPPGRWKDPGSFALATGLGASIVGQALFFNSDNYYADIRINMFWLGAGLLQALVIQSGATTGRRIA